MGKRERASLPEPYMRLTCKLLKALKDKLGDKLVSLVVYGSVARGEAKRDSDLDLLIVARDLPKGRLKRQELFEVVEKAVEEDIEKLRGRGYNVFLSPILKTPEEASKLSPLYLDMVEDAVILYDKEEFFKGVLDRLRSKLEELGARKVRLGKKWYWILKEDYEFGEVIEIE